MTVLLTGLETSGIGTFGDAAFVNSPHGVPARACVGAPGEYRAELDRSMRLRDESFANGPVSKKLRATLRLRQ